MSDMPFRSFFGADPFRGFEELTGRVFGGMEGWPPSRPGVQRVDVGRLLSAPARDVLSRALAAAGERGAPDLDALELTAAAARPGEARAAGDTPSLDEYGRDLTEEARQGRIDPVVGREDEIEQSIEVLSRRTKNNPCLIGEPGVGKTAIVEGIAQRIVNGSVPDTLKDRRVVALDLTGMVAGTKYRGEFEERAKKVIDEVRAIMTSNIGAQLILESAGDTAALHDRLMDLLRHSLRPELLNRIDETIIFRRLERDQLRQIVDLLLERTRQRLRGQDVTLEVTDAAKDWLARRGYQPEFGARPLRRTVQRELDNRLSTMLLTGEVSEGGQVTVDTVDTEADSLHLTAHNPAPA
ncbi:ATP-dependent Clp protease ATP-binding subunit [Nonomuraea sp. K274]|uniref:ATP-dependent Clp protease ATP-binding subunit n=1 Tax=Nonomuraea cypriaca TaxID=1187855 RepID=A0A931AIK5_9ACTN|nr:AAA family ATPase [Nonomuraea cypriaca]MBF8190810.1 ATP-dependent Clp protease ATP-binding subunit [Nonomuraea cypriaca]